MLVKYISMDVICLFLPKWNQLHHYKQFYAKRKISVLTIPIGDDTSLHIKSQAGYTRMHIFFGIIDLFGYCKLVYVKWAGQSFPSKLHRPGICLFMEAKDQKLFWDLKYGFKSIRVEGRSHM